MKITRHVNLTRGIKPFIISLALMLGIASTTQAATTGFNQTAAGPWDYNTAGNWVGNTINGIWDASLTNTAAQTVTFGADTALTTGLTFNYAGNFALTNTASAVGTVKLTLGGDIGVATPTGNAAANVTFGNASNHLNVDLGGMTRTMTVNANHTLTFTDIVSNGGIIKAGTGTLTLNNSNTYTSGTTISAGTVLAGAANALGTVGTITLGDVNTGATLLINYASGSIARPITVAAGTGTVIIGNGSTSSGTLSGAITLNRSVTLNASRDINFTGGISGTGDVTTGSGGYNIYFLTSENTFTGNLYIGSSCSLQLGNNSGGNTSFIPDTANVDIANGKELRFYKAGGNETINALTGSGVVISYTSDTLTVGAGNGTGTFSGVIKNQTGSLSISKTGTGTQTLSGANTYNGTTKVNNGTLKISAGALGNTAISFTGTGTFAVKPGNTTTINLGSTVAGTAGATLTIGANNTFDMTDGFISTCNLQQQASFVPAGLTVATGATFKFNIGNSGADKLAVTKLASVAGTVNITIDTTGASSLTQGATYDLITAVSGLTTGSPTWQFTGGGTSQLVTIGGLPYTLTLVSSDTAIRVSVGSATPHLAITSLSPASPAAGVGFDVTVQVLDTSDNPINVTGATEVTLTRRLGNGILAGVTNATIALGTSSKTISGVTYTKAESGVALTVTRVSGDDLTSGDSAVFTVAPGSPSKLAFGQQPGNTAPGAAITPAVTVLVQDAFGNTVTNDTSSVTISSTSTAFASDSILITNAIAGVATFNAIKPTTEGSARTLTASDGLLTEVTSSAFNIAVPDDYNWWYPINGTGPQVNPWTSTSSGGHGPGLINVGQFLIYGGGTFSQQGGTIKVSSVVDLGWNSGAVFNMSGSAIFIAVPAVNLNRDSSGTTTWSLTNSASVTLSSSLNFLNGSANHLLLSGAATFSVASLGGLNTAGEYISFASGSTAQLTVGTQNQAYYEGLYNAGYIRVDNMAMTSGTFDKNFQVTASTLSLKPLPPIGTLIQFF